MGRFGLLFLLFVAGSTQGGGQHPQRSSWTSSYSERLIEAEDPEAALAAIQAILALQDEHGLELPPAIHFSPPQTEFSTGSLLGAKDASLR